MPLCPLAATLLAAKRRCGLSFADLGARLGVDEVWLASLIHGQATANLAEADSLLEALAIPEAERQELREQLTTYPIKGALDPVIPTDPLLYRFHEILQVMACRSRMGSRRKSAMASCRRLISPPPSTRSKTPRVIGCW